MIDWREVFVPDVNLLEIFVRGSVMYLGTFIMLRVIMKREFGALAISDLIVIVFIADAAQNGMSGNYQSAPDGLMLIATLMFWAFMIDLLGYRFAWFQRLVSPRPLPLIRKGVLLRQNMRREFVTEDELMANLRSHGLTDTSKVKNAYIESDGTFSVITYDQREKNPPRDERSMGT